MSAEELPLVAAPDKRGIKARFPVTLTALRRKYGRAALTLQPDYVSAKAGAKRFCAAPYVATHCLVIAPGEWSTIHVVKHSPRTERQFAIPASGQRAKLAKLAKLAEGTEAQCRETLRCFVANIAGIPLHERAAWIANFHGRAVA